MNISFAVGDRVKWTSQSAGYKKEKRGVIVAILSAGDDVDKFVGVGCVCDTGRHYRIPGGGFGAPRNHASYLVAVKRKLYWPLVRHLERDNA